MQFRVEFEWRRPTEPGVFYAVHHDFETWQEAFDMAHSFDPAGAFKVEKNDHSGHRVRLVGEWSCVYAFKMAEPAALPSSDESRGGVHA